MTLAELVDRIPLGWTAVRYRGRRWGLSRTDHADGRTVTLEADELGGSVRMGANVLRLRSGDVLRPCEVPERDVLDLLEGWEPDRRDEGSALSGRAAPRRGSDPTPR